MIWTKRNLLLASKMVQTDLALGCKLLLRICARQLGRPDTCEEVVRKLKLFAATGTKVIIDLIYGLPGQTKELLQRDLQFYLDCGLSGVDLYKLQIFLGRRWAINLKLIRVISLLGGSWQSSLSAAQNF